MDVRRDLLLIFKEAVNNAVRHSRMLARGDRPARRAGSRLVLAVSDNGDRFRPVASMRRPWAWRACSGAPAAQRPLEIASNAGAGTHDHARRPDLIVARPRIWLITLRECVGLSSSVPSRRRSCRSPAIHEHDHQRRRPSWHRSPARPFASSIIEDLREVREGLAMLINGTSGFVCASSYRTMEDALERHRGAAGPTSS